MSTALPPDDFITRAINREVRLELDRQIELACKDIENRVQTAMREAMALMALRIAKHYDLSRDRDNIVITVREFHTEVKT